MIFAFNLKKMLSPIAGILILFQSFSVTFASDDPVVLQRLMGLKSSKPIRVDKAVSLRQPELDVTALSIGSSAGLKWRYDQIMNNILEPNSQYLDRIFNFNRFMADGKIFLPAVRIAKDDISFDENKQTLIRVSYTISEEAILRSAAPSFRDYLYHDFPSPEDPHWKLMPENSQEERRWREKIKEGFEQGILQANDIYFDNLAEMKSDYLDRQNFLNLVAKNMISKPSILVQKNGITFNGRTMNVGEIVYEMSEEAQYLEHSNWRSVWGE